MPMFDLHDPSIASQVCLSVQTSGMTIHLLHNVIYPQLLGVQLHLFSIFKFQLQEARLLALAVKYRGINLHGSSGIGR